MEAKDNILVTGEVILRAFLPLVWGSTLLMHHLAVFGCDVVKYSKPMIKEAC